MRTVLVFGGWNNIIHIIMIKSVTHKHKIEMNWYFRNKHICLYMKSYHKNVVRISEYPKRQKNKTKQVN